MKTRTVVAALLALAVASGSAQTLDKTKLDQLLDRLAAKNKGMGSLTLAKAGNILYSHSFGYRSVNGTQKTPGDASTKYRIGSITKTYTAVMVLQLVIDPGVFFEFDAAKGTMTIKRPQGERVFTKEERF